MNPTKAHDRLHFAHLPTPLEPMDRLSRHIGGPHLFIKRDDCTGLATGGNKARKLEFLMAEAVGQKADTVITQGAVQSNHARQTAAIASRLNMGCVLALENRTESNDALYLHSGNVLLDNLYGATIHHFPAGSDMDAAMRDLAERHKARGNRPYIIPGGGSNPVGSLGYVNCAFEIAEQLKQQRLRIDRIVHATGSTGTQAGLVVGFHLAEMEIPILGISVRLPKEQQEEKVYDLVKRTSKFLDLEEPPAREKIMVNADYVGDGYGIPTLGMLKAVTMVARHESILLDPVYSGKAMDGLLDIVANKGGFRDEENILFLHTGGSVGLFGYMAAVDAFLSAAPE